jgi:SOS-response transcriptional repressor LexA
MEKKTATKKTTKAKKKTTSLKSKMKKSGTGTLSVDEIVRVVKLASSKAMQIRDDLFGGSTNG